MKINIDHYNRMFDALKTIANGYQTTDQLRRNSKKDFGLDFAETLELAYDNIQQLAKEATRNVRKISNPVETATTSKQAPPQ